MHDVNNHQELLERFYPAEIVHAKPGSGMSFVTNERMLPQLSRLWIGSKLKSKSQIEGRAIAAMQRFIEQHPSAVAQCTPLINFII